MSLTPHTFAGAVVHWDGACWLLQATHADTGEARVWELQAPPGAAWPLHQHSIADEVALAIDTLVRGRRERCHIIMEARLMRGSVRDRLAWTDALLYIDNTPTSSPSAHPMVRLAHVGEAETPRKGATK